MTTTTTAPTTAECICKCSVNKQRGLIGDRKTKRRSCGNKVKNIIPSIVWRREAWKEEALDDLPSKDEKRAIVSQTNIGTAPKATLGKQSFAPEKSQGWRKA